jgi:hypothetical protein
MTQWDALVRRFQARAKQLLPYWYLFPSDGNCADFLSNLSSALSTGGRLRDALTVDGIWGPETSDALGAMLCMYNQTTLAQRLATNVHTRGAIPLDTLVSLAFFAANVTAITPRSITTNPGGVTLNSVHFPSDTLLPNWTTRVNSAAANQDWIGTFPLAPNAPAPTPPTSSTGTTNEAGGNAPQPATTDTGLLSSVGVQPPAPTTNTGTGTGTGTTTTTTTATTTYQAPAGAMPGWAWGALILGVVVIGGIAYYAMSDGSRVPVGARPAPGKRPPPARVQVTGYRAPPRRLPRPSRPTTIRIS